MSLEDKGAAESRRKRIDCNLGAEKAERQDNQTIHAVCVNIGGKPLEG